MATAAAAAVAAASVVGTALEVRAIDKAGNTDDAKSASYTWIVTAQTATATAFANQTATAIVDQTATAIADLTATANAQVPATATAKATSTVVATEVLNSTPTATTVYVAPSPTATATVNASATATATVSPSPSPTRTATPNPNGPKLALDIRGPKQIIPGKAAWFVIYFSNFGKLIAQKVRITMILPPYTLFDAANSTAGWVLLKTANTQAGQLTAGETYVFEPGDLNASQSGEVTFATTVQADAPAGTTLNAEASIGDSTSTGSTTTAKSNTVVEVVGYSIYLNLILK